MTGKFSNNQRLCATCAFWAGNRGVDALRSCVSVDSITQQGKCGNSSGSMKGTAKAPNCGGCKDWQKYSLLK